MNTKQLFEQFLALDAGYDVDRLAFASMEADPADVPGILRSMLRLGAGYDVDTLVYNTLQSIGESE